MRILIAPDSFKGSLTAKQVALAIQKGLKKSGLNLQIELTPLADGGEGTVEAVISATKGTLVNLRVKDPLMRDINSFYGILPDKNTVVIEMAAASGITLLKKDEKDPLLTSTYGTGQIIKDALKNGFRKLIIGIGGSATNDGGVGMAKALGVKFYDKDKNEIGNGGGNIHELETIDVSELLPEVKNTEISVACDVRNPLTGKEGASLVYGPQKGADRKVAEQLDNNLKHLAEVIRKDLQISIEHIPGAGAAGGLGGGMIAFLGARLKPGFELISELLHLEDKIKNTDLIITGEGKLDDQTLFGKGPFALLEMALKLKKPVIAICGDVDGPESKFINKGFHRIYLLKGPNMTSRYAMENSKVLLEKTAHEAISDFSSDSGDDS